MIPADWSSTGPPRTKQQEQNTFLAGNRVQEHDQKPQASILKKPSLPSLILVL